MKKFSLLALVAVMVMAFAGAAFADNGDVSALAAYGDYTGNAVNNNDGVTVADPAGWKTDAFYFGTPQKLMIGSNVTVADATTANATRLGAVVDTAAAVFNETTPDVGDLSTAKDARFNMPFSATAFNMVIGAYTADGTTAIAATKTLAVTPREVTFAASDVTNGAYTLKTDGQEKTITITGAYNDGAAKTIEGAALNLVVKSGDKDGTSIATKQNIIGDGTNGVEATYADGVITLKSNGSVADGQTATLTVMGTTAGQAVTATKETVAGIDENTVIMTIVVTTASYNVKPTSITYDLDKSSDIALSFDVDMPVASLSAISSDGVVLLSTAAEAGAKVGTTDDYLSNDIAVSADKPSTGYIVITLGKDHLKEQIGELVPAADGSISKTVTYKVVDSASKSADLVVEFVKAAPVLPQQNETQDVAADPNNTLLAATSNDVASAETVNTYVSEDLTGLAITTTLDGKSYVTQDAVVKAISDDNNIGIWGSKNRNYVTPLEIVSADIKNNGTIATISFGGIHGSTLVSGDRTGNGVRRVSANDLNIIKLVASKDVTALKRVGDVTNKKSADLDGKYNVYLNGTLVDTVSSSGDNYELRVYIADNGKYDLAKNVNGKVVDPLAIVKSTGASHSSSSSCDMGFGLAAVAGLAALALRKRSK